LGEEEALSQEVQEPAQVQRPARERPARERRPPDRYMYSVWVNAAFDSPEPGTVHDALNGPHKSKWQEAMEREINSLQDMDVWDLVELPKNRKVVGSKWVFKVKLASDGSVE
jgi:hypothetical protein